MTKTLIAALLLVAATATGAAAQQGRTRTATMCIDTNGRAIPPQCRVPASRVERTEDICQCFVGDKVAVPVCPSGVEPPPESRELEQARRTAVDNGTILSATFQGRPMCVRN